MDDKSVRALLLELITSMFPSLVLGGVHRYTVSRDNGDGRFDLAPAQKVLHPPRLRVEQWAAPGVEGGFVVGQEILVVFLDNDAERPAIIGHLPLRRGRPDSLKIDASVVITIGEHATAINIGGPAAGVLSKAQETANNFSAITAAMTAAVVVPGDGGASLKSTFLSGLAGAGYPAWTGTTKAKGV